MTEPTPTSASSHSLCVLSPKAQARLTAPSAPIDGGGGARGGGDEEGLASSCCAPAARRRRAVVVVVARRRRLGGLADDAVVVVVQASGRNGGRSTWAGSRGGSGGTRGAALRFLEPRTTRRVVGADPDAVARSAVDGADATAAPEDARLTQSACCAENATGGVPHRQAPSRSRRAAPPLRDAEEAALAEGSARRPAPTPPSAGQAAGLSRRRRRGIRRQGRGRQRRRRRRARRRLLGAAPVLCYCERPAALLDGRWVCAQLVEGDFCILGREDE